MLDGNDMRLRLSRDIFVPDQTEEGLGRLEAALSAVLAARDAQRKTKDAAAKKLLEPHAINSLAECALEQGLITIDEAQRLKIATKMQNAAIQVDCFTQEQYLALKG
jgi:acyl-CoA dehydrogenase